MATTIPQTGYAPVNGLKMYYEIHGTPRSAVPPLLLLHGALASIEMFGDLVTSMAGTRQVIAVEQQGHGRTADIDRPLRSNQMADDTAAFLEFLGIDRVDVFGISMGGGIALQIAIRHPELVRKLVVGSASSSRAHGYQEAAGGIEMTFRPDIFEGTPIEADYLRLAANPSDFPAVVEKVKRLLLESEEVPAETIAAIAAPTMIIVGDADIIRPEGAVEMFRLRGGGVPGDYLGMTPARLAVLPGTTHMTLPTRTTWLHSMITEFLDAADTADRQVPGGPLGIIGQDDGHDQR
jgi:pimeloyl-ACP methyl ester carboxylesterase